MNQCDGCRRGLPLHNGIHQGGEGDLIGCTKYLYTATPAEARELERKCRLIPAEMVKEFKRGPWPR